MSTCCKTTNLLRRDGTSQKQRFPLALAENYVKIDERSHADILNFLYDLALEFNYYGANNVAQGNWQDFFSEDLSFVLAQTLKVDVAEYRAVFDGLYANVVATFGTFPALPVTTFNALDPVFQFFMKTPNIWGPSGTTLEPLPLTMSRWIDLLPDSALYASTQSYFFRDLVLDGRVRLLPVARKLQSAHTASDAHGSGFNLTGWTNLEANGWDLSSVANLSTAYFSTVPELSEVQRVLELLRASFDTFVGMIESLQAKMPAYLAQSLKEFPWHNPQNALVLAFMQLFDHARDHLNSLTRKHLLYEYMDVLRFGKRPLTPDQAVVIVQLRKGIDRYKLDAGTLLKAGKDIDGKSMAYAVDNETVVNQAIIKRLMNVHVEGITKDPITSLIDIDIEGIYASPVANSANGLGLALPVSDPKWNLFGEAQLAFLPDDRTMPDARLGFAIASPLFVMKEGERTIDATFMVERSDLLIKVGNNYSPWERLAVNIRSAFTAQYTTAKGWAPAKIVSVAFIDNVNATKIGDKDLLPADVVTDTNWVAMNFQIVLDEGDAPFVVYNEKVHQEGLGTPWPVLKLNLQGQSDDYSTLPLTAFNGTGVPGKAFTLSDGNIYYNPNPNTPGNIKYALSDLQLLDGFDAFWSVYPGVTAYLENSNYTSGQQVIFNSGIYTALAAITQSTIGNSNQNPADYPHLWRRAFRTYLYQSLYPFTPQQLHLRVGVKGAFGLLYENDFGKLKAEKPFPIFGGSPVIGSRFYVGSQEIFGKHLEELSIEIVWQDPPDNLGRYYVKYEDVLTELNNAVNATHQCGGDCICCTPVTYHAQNNPQHAHEAHSTGRNSGNLVFDGQGYSEASAESNVSNQDAQAYGPPAETMVCHSICKPNGSFLMGNGQWTADIHFLYDGEWEYLDRKPLFNVDANGNGAKLRHTMVFPENRFTAFERDLNLGEHARLESNTPRGFIRFELATPIIAFGHKYYRDIYVDAVQYAVKHEQASVDAPNEPYTPIVKEIRLNYISKATIDFRPSNGFADDYNQRVDQYFHLHPFGHTEEHAFLHGGTTVTLLPQYTDEGSLYIGIEGLVTPSTLSVLYQLAEGSGDSDIELEPAIWSVLVGNQWIDLQRRDILLDTTDELITSGVIQYDFDGTFVPGSTLLDRTLHWLRVKVAVNTPAYMKAIDILAQAVLVSFHDQDNNPAHLAKALPAETIHALVVSDPSVKKLTQPYGSFGGKLPEEGDTFITRVSERLRHKQRSINVWDYEHLVLEEFPSIYKVKCLNHTEFKAPHTGLKDWEISPGHVTVVCIPDLRNLNAVNPFEPKTSIRTIQQVDAFLHRHVSAWVDLKVKNPLYEAIKINCRIGFIPGKDPGYYTQVLETAIQQFLSPWAFDHEQEIVFGGKIHRSKVIQLIEQQDYVDFIVNFTMDHIIGDEVRENVLEAVATTGRSILVSALDHAITSVKPDCELCIPGALPTVDTGCCTPPAQ